MADDPVGESMKRNAAIVLTLAVLLSSAAAPGESSGRAIPRWEVRAVTASSTSDLLEESRPVYRAPALIDGRHWTPWGEGALGDGAGERIRIELGGTRYLTGIGIVNGYPHNAQTWRDHGRAKSVTVQLGAVTFEAPLADADNLQVVELGDLVATDFVELRIDEVWPGLTGPLCLSELVLYEEPNVLARRPELRDTIESAVRDLRDPARSEAALKALYAIGVPAIPWLTRLKGEESPELRRSVARALGGAGASSVIAVLQEMYTAAKEPEVRETILDVFAELRSARAVPFLLDVVRISKPSLARKALRAMVGVGHPRTLPLFIQLVIAGEEAEAAIAIEHLEAYRTVSVRPLVHHLATTDTRVRARALWALARIRLPLGYHVVDGRIGREPEPLALAAIRGLDESRTPRAFDVLARHVGDRRSAVRLAVISALGGYPTKRSARLLEQLVRDDADPLVRNVAWASLARAGAPGAEVLGRLFSQGTPEEQDTAFGRLVATPGAGSLAALISLLADHRPARRAEVRAAILARPEGGGKAFVTALGYPSAAVRSAASRYLTSLGREAVPLLLPAATRGPATQRAAAIRCLARIGDARAVDVVLEGLEADDREVRRAAVRATGHLPSDRYGDRLIAMLSDPVGEIAEGAVHALGSIRYLPALEALVARLVVGKRSSESVIWALGEIRDERAVEALEAPFRTREPLTRLVVIDALGKIGGKKARGLLIEAIFDADPTIRRRAELAARK